MAVAFHFFSPFFSTETIGARLLVSVDKFYLSDSVPDTAFWEAIKKDDRMVYCFDMSLVSSSKA
jgi:hypothetical protein